tara:strand:- start:300 stop:962 length:663 start_codon:yes stop_codon:yes gene_type:complete
MKFTFLKAIFTSAIILSSTLANAGIINQWDVDFAALNNDGKFNAATIQKSTSFAVNGDVLTLNHNSWYYVNLADAIGVSSLDLGLLDTTLSFDFMTSGTPEISGVQISDVSHHDITGAFNLIGTQNWGLKNFSYSDIGQWVTFEINLSDYFSNDTSTKAFSTLMFINDCDNCSNSNIDVSFRNMSITQSSDQLAAQVPEPTTLAIFALGVIGLASRRFKK